MFIRKHTIEIELFENELNKWYKTLPELSEKNSLIFDDIDDRSKKIAKEWEISETESINSITKINKSIFSVVLNNDEIKIFRSMLPSELEMKNLLKEDHNND